MRYLDLILERDQGSDLKSCAGTFLKNSNTWEKFPLKILVSKLALIIKPKKAL